MRKCMALIVAGLLMLVLTGNAMAVDNEAFLTDTTKVRVQMQEEKLNKLKEFNDELDQISALQRERLSLRIEINESHQQIRSLLIKALENQDKEALQEAREVRQKLDSLNKEIRAMYEEFRENRQGFREALKNNDIPQAQVNIDNMIRVSENINSKDREKLDILQRIITILS